MAITYRKEDGSLDERYVGAVLATGEYNGPDDSDFYAVVWDEETGEVKRVEYATTRYPSTGNAVVDATPETVAKARAWYVERAYRDLVLAAQEKAEEPKKGDLVRVARGRKVKVGTVGRLFWIGETRVYGGYSRWSQHEATRVGVALDDERDANGRYVNVAWTYLENLEAYDPEGKLPRLDDLRERAERSGDLVAAEGAWRSATHVPTPGWAFM